MILKQIINTLKDNQFLQIKKELLQFKLPLDLHQTVKQLNALLDKYKIKLIFYDINKTIDEIMKTHKQLERVDIENFVFSQMIEKHGISKAEAQVDRNINFDIHVYIYSDYELVYLLDKNNFIKKLINVISHQLTHRRVAQKTSQIGNAALNKYVQSQKYRKNYYKSKLELIAFANQIVEQLCFLGFKKADILNMIRYDIFPPKFSMNYTVDRIRNSGNLKILYSYIYTILNG